MKGRRRQLVFEALGLAVVVVTFAVVLRASRTTARSGSSSRSSTAPGCSLLPGSWSSTSSHAPPWMIALPGLRFRQALPFTQASTALTCVAGGGLVGMAGSYGAARLGLRLGEVAR